MLTGIWIHRGFFRTCINLHMETSRVVILLECNVCGLFLLVYKGNKTLLHTGKSKGNINHSMEEIILQRIEKIIGLHKNHSINCKRVKWNKNKKNIEWKQINTITLSRIFQKQGPVSEHGGQAPNQAKSKYIVIPQQSHRSSHAVPRRIFADVDERGQGERTRSLFRETTAS